MTETSASWQDVREEILADEETRAEYERGQDIARLVRAVIVGRNARKWSQRQLAEAAGLKQPAVARFERGDSDPRFATIVRICRALDLPLTVGTEEIVEGVKIKRQANARQTPAATGKGNVTKRDRNGAWVKLVDTNGAKRTKLSGANGKTLDHLRAKRITKKK